MTVKICRRIKRKKCVKAILKGEYIAQSRVLTILHSIGGCGAKPDTWEAGFDDAINVAYDKIANEPTINIATPIVHDGINYCPNCGAIMPKKKQHRHMKGK